MSETYQSEAAVFDPTNVDIRQGGQVFYGSQPRFSEVFMSSRWSFKLNGMVQLPADINVAGRFNGRQGYMFPPSFWTPNRGGGIGRADVLLEPLGDSRLRSLWIADLRLEKVFAIGQTRLGAMVEPSTCSTPLRSLRGRSGRTGTQPTRSRTYYRRGF